jgi:hypothetical protein
MKAATQVQCAIASAWLVVTMASNTRYKPHQPGLTVYSPTNLPTCKHWSFVL